MPRLAAVLAADVAGYSRLMGEDQAATLAALRRLREEIFAPTIAARRGRVVKSMGDGWLVLFDSTVDAVSCALQIQDQLARPPADGAAEIRLRIGIHIGDVAEEGEDIFGDAVNIAARLEGASEPGAVAVSDAVRVNLDGALRPAFDDRGVQELKNIDRPIRVWSRAPQIIARRTAAGGWPEVIVLPVRAHDDRAEVREIANALTGDLAQMLDSPRWLAASVATAGTEGAYLLGCQLRARGDRLRLETTLSAPDGALLWSEKHDGDLADSFDWQDDVAAETAARGIAAIVDHKRLELSRESLDAMSAEQAETLALLNLEEYTTETHSRALRYAIAATEKDPDSPSAFGALLTVLLTGAIVGLWKPTDFEQLPEWLRRAQGMKGRDPHLDFVLAHADYIRTLDRDAFRAEIARALRHPSRDFLHLSYVAFGLVWLGEPEPGLACAEKGLRSGRFSATATPVRAAAALACICLGRYEAAMVHVREGMALNPTFITLDRAAACALAHLGRMDEARAALAKVLAQQPDDTVSGNRDRIGYQDNEATRRYLDGLRLAGLPE